MTRLNAALVAAGLAVGAVGCAHCDTCDDFPAPCVGPNCGGQYGVYGPGAGPMAADGPMTAAPAPGASLGPVIDGVGAPPSAPAPGGSGAAPGTPAVNPAIESRPATPPGGATATPPGEPSEPPIRPGS